MNARLEQREMEVEATNSTIDVRLKHIEGDIAEIKADLRTNAAEIRAVSEKVDLRAFELNDRIVAQGKELNDKIVVQGKELSDRIEAQGKELSDRIVAQGKELSARISELSVSNERTRVWMLRIVLGFGLAVLGVVLQAWLLS